MLRDGEELGEKVFFSLTSSPSRLFEKNVSSSSNKLLYRGTCCSGRLLLVRVRVCISILVFFLSDGSRIFEIKYHPRTSSSQSMVAGRRVCHSMMRRRVMSICESCQGVIIFVRDSYEYEYLD